MANRFIAFFFMLVFLGEIFDGGVIMVDFYVNQSYIAKNLCENRDKPQMHCNGKCQLEKKMEQESKKDQESPERRSDNKNEIVLSSESFAPAVPSNCWLETKNKNKIPSSIAKSIDRSFDIFHPPRT
ncbi:MAG TPA: hypothetical protein VH396_13235 [Chitinophagaceae bacterium]